MPVSVSLPTPIPSFIPAQLSWPEIRSSLVAFIRDHRDSCIEMKHSQHFVRDLLDCYGVSRHQIDFEHWATRESTGNKGRIDAFIPGVLLIEMKSRGEDLDAALSQAHDYLLGGDLRDDFPLWVVVSDFESIWLQEVSSMTAMSKTFGDPIANLPAPAKLKTTELPSRSAFLGFLAGRDTMTNSEPVVEASQKAAKLMGELFAALTEDFDSGSGEVLTQEDEDFRVSQAAGLLTKILFLLYGEDSGLFEEDAFTRFLKASRIDGTDLGDRLTRLFQWLDTPDSRRRLIGDPNDKTIACFPYVNGSLFAHTEESFTYTRTFSSRMREALVEAAMFSWRDVSPAVFGSLFQSIKSREARRSAGEHYTTLENIHKVTRPLFLEELEKDFVNSKNSRKKLLELWGRLGKIRVLDPACGSGNFLISAYQDLRALETEVLEALSELSGRGEQQALDATWSVKVTIDHFSGIEIGWWPAKIAETAMFLAEHQANCHMEQRLGWVPPMLPLKIRARIHHQDALSQDWSELVPNEEGTTTYVIGNPPFLGSNSRNSAQTAALKRLWGGTVGQLDFSTGWHAQAMRFFSDRRKGEFAFVTTNSIVQGEPVATLFYKLREEGWHIKFGYRTFPWTSEASGKAAVHCVIVGFTKDKKLGRLFDYDLGNTIELKGNEISPYLSEGGFVVVEKRSSILSPLLSPVSKGSQPTDDGNLIVESTKFEEVSADSVISKYLRPYRGAAELLQGKQRWCLWLEKLDPSDIHKSNSLKNRISNVKSFRENSKKEATRKWSAMPHLFTERRQPEVDYLCIPRVASENRDFFPTDRFDSSVIASDAVFTAPDPDGFLFSIVSSSMFITWQRAVGGRLESRLRFSNTIVWNNLPLPEVSESLRQQIIEAGRKVLEARELHQERSLAEHYNPLAMDPTLLKAHRELDKVVDKAFGAKRTLSTEAQRQAILFQRYAEMTETEKK